MFEYHAAYMRISAVLIVGSYVFLFKADGKSNLKE
jgi:hypothetical protein